MHRLYFTGEYDPSCTIVVENIPEELDEEDIELFFESKKYSNGGALAGVKFFRAASRAIVQFQHADSEQNKQTYIKDIFYLILRIVNYWHFIYFCYKILLAQTQNVMTKYSV